MSKPTWHYVCPNGCDAKYWVAEMSCYYPVHLDDFGEIIDSFPLEISHGDLGDYVTCPICHEEAEGTSLHTSDIKINIVFPNTSVSDLPLNSPYDVIPQ